MELPSLLQSTETNRNENHHIHHSAHHSTRGSLTRKHTNSTTGVLGLCGCCPETPLSTTRNIIKLLTFAGGLFTAYAAYAAAVWGAGHEIQYTLGKLRSRAWSRVSIARSTCD